jgi:hypothetical protein
VNVGVYKYVYIQSSMDLQPTPSKAKNDVGKFS